MKRKVQWCYVGDTVKVVENKAIKRIFLADVGGDYSTLAVDVGSESKYIDGNGFDVATWKYCELIKEPEYIPFDAKNIDDVKQLVGLVQETEDGRIRQIGLTEEQSKQLQFYVALISQGSPLVQMGEEYDLVLKSECGC